VRIYTRTLKQVSRCPPLRYGAALSSLAMSGLAFLVAPATKQVNRKGQNSTPRQSPHQNPLTDLHKKLSCVITSWTAPGMQNLIAIGSGASAPQIRDFACRLGDYSLLFAFGFFNKVQPIP